MEALMSLLEREFCDPSQTPYVQRMSKRLVWLYAYHAERVLRASQFNKPFIRSCTYVEMEIFCQIIARMPKLKVVNKDYLPGFSESCPLAYLYKSYFLEAVREKVL
jgi:hypothetical protein